MSEMTLGDLTTGHIGHPVYGIDGIGGWESHLLLRAVAHREGTTTVMFRWNDDPSPSNTERGQFACGVTLPSDSPCSLTPPSNAEAPQENA